MTKTMIIIVIKGKTSGRVVSRLGSLSPSRRMPQRLQVYPSAPMSNLLIIDMLPKIKLA